MKQIRVSQLLLLAVLPLLAVIYLPALFGEFVFDDFSSIVANPRVHLESLTPQYVWEAMWSWRGEFWRPLSYLTFAINHYFAGLSPFWFKLTNLVLHAVNGVLLYAFLVRLLGALHQKNAALIALVVTALWLVHPINLTAIAYVVQRMTELSALFTLTGLLAFLSWRQRVLTDGGWHLKWLALFGASALLAFLSKESGILVFVFVALLEVCLRNGNKPTGTTQHRITLIVSLPLVIGASLVLLVLLFDPDPVLAGYAFRPFSLAERLLTQPRVLFFYMENIVVPDIRQLGLFLDDFALSRHLLDPPATAAALAGLAGLAAVAVAALPRFPVIAFGILFFFAGHSLESTFLPLEIAFEHRNYLSGVGILLALVAALNEVLASHDGRRAAAILSVTAVLVFASATLVRAYTWSNPTMHMLLEVAHHPASPRANAELARLLVHAHNLPHNRHNDALLMLAETHLERSMSAGRFSREGSYNLISLAYSQPAVSTDAFDWESLEYELSTGFVNHVDARGLDALVNCQRVERCSMPDVRLESLLDAALRNERLAPAWRGKLLMTTSKHYLHKAQEDRAREYVRTAHQLAMRTQSVPILIEVARFHGKLGERQKAREVLDLAVHFDGWRIYRNVIATERKRLND